MSTPLTAFGTTFWEDTGERMIRTGAQYIVATLGVDAAVSGITGLDWRHFLSVLVAQLTLCLFTCLAAATKGSPATASFQALPVVEVPVPVPANVATGQAVSSAAPAAAAADPFAPEPDVAATDTELPADDALVTG